MKRAILFFGLAALAATPASAGDRGSTQPKDTVRGAILSPLEDVNLKVTDIPPVLVRAMDNPYDVKGLTRCEPIAAEIGRLDAALGDDLDEPPPPAKTGAKQATRAVKGAAIGTVRDESRSIIPFRGWVRKLTGAERRQKAVQAAIKAGGVRRGYLKGLGMNMNCAPPAAPSWYVPKVIKPVAAKTPSLVDQLTSWWPWELRK
ncbi:hypothetical protein BH11PSE2_BH11PSE2_20120 [soil metagenome]